MELKRRVKQFAMNSKTGINGYSIEVDRISRKQWRQVLGKFADASIYQTWDYGAVRWGEENLSHMVLRKKGEVVSAVQVRILMMPLFKVGMAYVTYGPMWKLRGTEWNVSNFQAALRVLVEEYAVSRGLILRLRPWGFDEDNDNMGLALANEGFSLNKGLYRDKQRTILLDLSPKEEELRRRLKKKWRWNLRYAESANLEIVRGFDSELFDLFKPLYFEMLDAKKFKPGSDVNEFSQIQEKLFTDQRMRITICKSRGQPVSGSVCSPIGDTVLGLLSATGGAGRRERAYYLLQWEEILWSKRVGKRFYDLGGVNPVTNPGVYHFKAGLGGREVTFLGVFDFCNNNLLYSATLGLESLLRLRNRLIA